MVANPKFLAATAHVDDAAVQPLPRSRKVYVEGSRADIRVPMREITQSETPASFGAEKKGRGSTVVQRANVFIDAVLTCRSQDPWGQACACEPGVQAQRNAA